MSQPDNRPIGVFDSGVGGLTVLKAIREALPQENLLYLGDTARLPYGTKSARSVMRYARRAAGFLSRYETKMLVIACNTASAVALDDLRESLAPMPVIGVVEPGARAAVKARPGGSHLVLATEAVGDPRTDTRPTHENGAGIHLINRLRMIDTVAVA